MAALFHHASCRFELFQALGQSQTFVIAQCWQVTAGPGPQRYAMVVGKFRISSVFPCHFMLFHASLVELLRVLRPTLRGPLPSVRLFRGSARARAAEREHYAGPLFSPEFIHCCPGGRTLCSFGRTSVPFCSVRHLRRYLALAVVQQLSCCFLPSDVVIRARIAQWIVTGSLRCTPLQVFVSP